MTQAGGGNEAGKMTPGGVATRDPEACHHRASRLDSWQKAQNPPPATDVGGNDGGRSKTIIFGPAQVAGFQVTTSGRIQGGMRR